MKQRNKIDLLTVALTVPCILLGTSANAQAPTNCCCPSDTITQNTVAAAGDPGTFQGSAEVTAPVTQASISAVPAPPEVSDPTATAILAAMIVNSLPDDPNTPLSDAQSLLLLLLLVLLAPPPPPIMYTPAMQMLMAERARVQDQYNMWADRAQAETQTDGDASGFTKAQVGKLANKLYNLDKIIDSMLNPNNPDPALQ